MESIIAVAGGAGSGKTTLGRALCAELGATLIDLDAATAQLVGDARAAAPDVAEGDLLKQVREARYVELAVQARQARGSATVVIAAPLTREISSDADWQGFVDAVGGPQVQLVWIEVSEQERLRRMRLRGSSRDAKILAAGQAPPVAPPAVPALTLAAELPTAEKVTRVLSRFDNGNS